MALNEVGDCSWYLIGDGWGLAYQCNGYESGLSAYIGAWPALIAIRRQRGGSKPLPPVIL